MSDGRVLDLDDPRCANPRLAGAKASWLARGRQHSLSVLPGLVVTAAVSLPALRRGTETLTLRGSGGARLEVGRFQLDSALLEEITANASRLGSSLAVRASSVLDGGGEWSGAFASYLDVASTEIERAIAGCWASAFTVDALARFQAVGLEPVSAEMAVLIQPLLRPDYGGIARLAGNDEVEILGIKGSPAPLVQGWAAGVRVLSRLGGALDGGNDAITYLGSDLIAEVTSQLRAAHRSIGANTCEWAVAGGSLSLLQLGIRAETARTARPAVRMFDTRLIDLARLARRYPGVLGEALVLGWAASDPAAVIGSSEVPTTAPAEPAGDPGEALALAVREAGALAADVWQMPGPMASARAASILRQVRGNHPERALDCLERLEPPDPDRAARVLRLLTIVQRAVEVQRPHGTAWIWHQPVERLGSILRDDLEDNPSPRSLDRIGIDRWEPFQAAVVESFGKEHSGVAASPGVGCGRLCFISGPEQVDGFRPRDVVVVIHPVPSVAPLLWDAAGLVTGAGSPAAHLFDSARSLNVPAVCSVDLSSSLGGNLADSTGRFALAVDGNMGVVYVSDW